MTQISFCVRLLCSQSLSLCPLSPSAKLQTAKQEYITKEKEKNLHLRHYFLWKSLDPLIFYASKLWSLLQKNVTITTAKMNQTSINERMSLLSERNL